MKNFWFNIKSVFDRRPNRLKVIDGLKAVAVLWIFIYHVSLFVNFQFIDCLYNKKKYFFKLFLHGDLGVDIFLVISGFLIGNILHIELEKYGDIDFTHFIRNRFIRLWPATAFYVTISLILICIAGANGLLVLKHLSHYLFLNNLVGKPLTHLWAIAVEFQCYLITPFLVTRMTTKIFPLVIILLSFFLNQVLAMFVCRPQDDGCNYEVVVYN